MGQVLHGCDDDRGNPSRNTLSQESLRALSKRYGINPKPVAKWKKRGSVADLPAGPKTPRSTVLSTEEEAIPHLTRSSLHQCLQRHGISRLPEVASASAFLVASDRSRSLQDRHRSDQRHPVHLPAALRRRPLGSIRDAHVRHALP
jgi:hypothetical protein